MTSDLGELLHEGLDRLTADAKLPAGLVGRARLRNRQRRTAIRACLAAGTALAAAAAAIIVTSGAGRGPQGGGAAQTQTVAYVTSRTQQALAAAKGRAIEEILTSGRHVTFGFTVLNTALSEEKTRSAAPSCLAFWRVSAPSGWSPGPTANGFCTKDSPRLERRSSIPPSTWSPPGLAGR